MISTSQTKLIRSLRQKKYRDQHHLYPVEGEKMIRELIGIKPDNMHSIHQLFATRDWIDKNESLLSTSGFFALEVTASEIKKISNLITPPSVLALVNMPDPHINPNTLLHKTVLAFESIRDPGNLGTIIRTADWFGIDQVICTPDSADVYNPKVVQSTMGAISRVTVVYMELKHLLNQEELKRKTVYGTFLDGHNIYEMALENNPVILFGNESHGLSSRYDSFIRHRIAIPSFSRNGKGSESLNVASSVAVLCSELRRGDRSGD